MIYDLGFCINRDRNRNRGRRKVSQLYDEHKKAILDVKLHFAKVRFELSVLTFTFTVKNPRGKRDFLQNAMRNDNRGEKKGYMSS